MASKKKQDEETGVLTGVVTPPGEMTPHSVQLLAASLMPQREMAHYLGVSLSTLERRLREPEYRQAYLRGRIDTKLQIRMALLRSAIKDRNSRILKHVAQHYLGHDGAGDHDVIEHGDEPPKRVIVIDEEFHRRRTEIREQIKVVDAPVEGGGDDDS